MKRHAARSIDPRVRVHNNNVRMLLTSYLTLMLLVGVQMGLIVGMGQWGVPSYIQPIVMMLYWALVSAAFVMLVSSQMRRGYGRPMETLGKAAKKVASGDFSVYVKPRHPAEKADYIDVMFMDFNTMVAELGSIETLKNDFIANVSHEIKTPLAVIRNYTNLLQKKALTQAETDECLASLAQATDRLTSLVTNILKLNKLDSQQIATAAAPFDLCGQLAGCALDFEPLWEKKHIQFDADMEDQATFVGDAEALRLVWNNLLSNAIKFTPEGGRITLRQTSDAERITVSLADTGCGMDEQTLRHAFDKFYQGDTSHSGEGNGLGLALAHRIVEKSGGTLSVTSRPGEGSTFTVSLPVFPEGAA